MLAGATLFGRRGSGVAVNLPLASLAGKVAGGLTYTRASGQWYQDDAGVWQYAAANVPAFNSKGTLLEPGSTNKCTCYGVIPADVLGAELVAIQSDREFSSDTGFWTKDSGVTISAGVANFSGSDKNIFKPGLVSVGKVYEITYTVVSISSGGFRAYAGGIGELRTTPGTYTDRVVASAAVGVRSYGVTVGSIDNISIKEVQFGIGTKSYHNGTAFVQNHTNMTLSGDVAAVLTTVDDTAALAAAGLSNLAASGKVYKLDNSAGAANAEFVVGGLTGNVNVHAFTAFVRATAGTPILKDNFGLADSVNTASASYSRASIIHAALNASSQIQFRCPAGAVGYFIMPQLEELGFASSLMPSQGATATRAATVPSFGTAGLRTNNLSGKFTWAPAAASQGTRWLWGSYLDADNYVGVLHDGTNLIFRKRITGVNYDATKALTYAAGTAYNIGFRLSASSSDIFINSVKGTANANAASIVYGTTLKIGQDGNGGSLQAGGIKDFKIYSRVLVDGSF